MAKKARAGTTEQLPHPHRNLGAYLQTAKSKPKPKAAKPTAPADHESYAYDWRKPQG